jgi:hypothetical protein
MSQFSKDFSNLLSKDDIEELIDFDSPYEKANFIYQFIKDMCLIYNKSLYIKQKNNTYKIYSSYNDILITMITKLFCDSVKELSKEDLIKFKTGLYRKSFVDFQSNTGISKYIPQLVTMLTMDEVIFDYTPGEIHFKNGFINVKEHKLYPRTDSHYITKYINRDYEPSTESQRNAYYAILNKIYPNKIDRDLVLSIISTSLSWKAPTLAISLFLIGLGSSGKSTILLHLQQALECYFHELKSDTFSNDKNMDKVLNTFSNNPQILLAWINEMDSKKCNTSVYKSFCDGVVNTVKLYQEESHNIKLSALCVATSNEMPNIQQDSGSKRRMKGYQHQSKFTKNPEEVNESKNIYLADKSLNDKVPILYNAIFDIYCKHCSEWLNGKEIDFNKSKHFQDTTDLICETNDYFQDFIDKHLKITQKHEDRIGKEEMRELFLCMFKDKHVSVLNVISALTDKGIKYSKDYRCNSLKGCFYGVKIKDDDDEVEDDKIDDTPVNNKVEETKIDEDEDMDILDQINMYEKYIRVLRKKFVEKSNKTIKATKQETKQEPKQEPAKERKVPKKVVITKKVLITNSEYDESDFEIDFN